MDEQLNQGNGTVEQPSVGSAEEQTVVPAAEPPLQNPPAEAASEAPAAQADAAESPDSSELPIAEENSQQPYSYQNPYQPYGTPFVPCAEQKKSRNLPLIITAAMAGCIMLGCCLIIAAGILRDAMTKQDVTEDQGIFNGQFTTDQQIQNGGIERDENAVYNMPEIITEEKKGEELSLVEINKKVKNSVIGILVSYEEKKEAAFSGSGVIISEDGYILTNNHVIEGATKLTIVLSDGITEYQAAVVGRDERSDIAVLKIEASGLTAAELGNSDSLEVGETVVAIGNPYGMELAGTMTNGIVSALNRKIEMNGSFMTLIQTNASINPGNSGGPLVNAYGQVVGITSSKLVATGYEGIGFAIPINYVVDISEELITYGYIKTRAYIGIQGSSLTAEYAEYYDLPMGVYVYYVDPECSAAAQGLRKDDVIVGFAGEEITSMAELNALKDAYKPGDKVKLKVWREGETFEIEITLTEST
ncbi:MAG: trypsin-like peptidase domain-containing protein [Clostridia bacterium]|nr:trypsin-like peptidase domain-containing protein [Clostridia bacterium]